MASLEVEERPIRGDDLAGRVLLASVKSVSTIASGRDGVPGRRTTNLGRAVIPDGGAAFRLKPGDRFKGGGAVQHVAARFRPSRPGAADGYRKS
jgi:hypothetical protein